MTWCLKCGLWNGSGNGNGNASSKNQSGGVSGPSDGGIVSAWGMVSMTLSWMACRRRRYRCILSLRSERGSERGKVSALVRRGEASCLVRGKKVGEGDKTVTSVESEMIVRYEQYS